VWVFCLEYYFGYRFCFCGSGMQRAATDNSVVIITHKLSFRLMGGETHAHFTYMFRQSQNSENSL
jgi:hypothetical protein